MPDLSGPPPPRWRVVERDRKLVVIDTQSGRAMDADAAAPLASSWTPQQIQFDGAAELTTHPLYDAKGPRTLRLDPGSVATLGRLKLVAVGFAFVAVIVATTNPWLLLPLLALTDRRLRARLRQAATTWLDRVAREAS